MGEIGFKQNCYIKFYITVSVELTLRNIDYLTHKTTCIIFLLIL